MRDLYLFWDFRPPHVLEVIWEASIQHVMFEHFVQRSQSNTKNPEHGDLWFNYHANQ
jgi:hypothetical protein